MCGIAGYICPGKKIAHEQFKKATSLMQHRGPDAEGFYFSEDNTVGFSHKRLSILDLSGSANQPMFSADGRYCIVFNGEIYNFSELKILLKDKGAFLKTTSDTEVIVELFAQLGPDSFPLLNGMFAFAIYDLQQKMVTLCRDHVGIKPLFYYQDDDVIIFASELKVIKSLLREKITVNKAAIPYFLHLGFIPEPQTIYNDTFKFPSAHYIQVKTDSRPINRIYANTARYWSLGDTVSTYEICDEKSAALKLKDLLFDSVQKQLVSDVPLGTFLSGGIDSSIVTAVAASVSGSKKVKTFSIAIDNGKYNESAFAKAVASHLHTEHYEFAVKEKEVLELVPGLIAAYDEPFADSSAFPTMMVSRLARQHVTVALSGDGGDELFHGYGMYKWAKRLSAPTMPLVRNLLYTASKKMPSRYRRAGNMFHYPKREHIISHIFSQEQYYFKEQELNTLLIGCKFDFDRINALPSAADRLSPSARQSYWDFNYYLKDDLLVKVDRASMQFSLESRVPLLDYRLVEFAYGLADNLKVKNGVTKYLLKEALYELVPRQLFDRQKWGFSIPLVKWLRTDLKFLMDAYTSKEIIKKYGLVDYNEVAVLKDAYQRGMDYLYNRLWLIIVLHWWLEEEAKIDHK